MTPSYCHELIESLFKAKTVEDIHSVFSRFCCEFGFDHAMYGARLPSSFAKPSLIVISGYPVDWHRRYFKNNYQEIDPVVSHCYVHHTPISWDRIAPLEKRSPKIRRFMGEARDSGLRSGVTFPVHSSNGELALFSLASEQNHKNARTEIAHVMPHGQLFIGYLHEAVLKVFKPQSVPLMRAHLTPQERECLLWSADGKTSWEIATILKISERTVRFHIRNASEKLNAVSRQHAVARAVSLGLINSPSRLILPPPESYRS